ncbi:hypothetical protein FOL47_006743 [Perkinsus chesapeaki]|uniref:Uncharacterized protein n=1 Tax=Perkinsus chesapeaki TaxID=330153 RepID=A0A7J6LPV0_PERCH|nr:hypothetical protein FOL47_006743 [Perkinsus chesapeaki]
MPTNTDILDPSDELDDLIESTLKEMDDVKAEESKGDGHSSSSSQGPDRQQQEVGVSRLEQSLNELVKGLEESAKHEGSSDDEDLRKLMEAMKKLDLGDDEEFMKEINGLTKGMFAKEAIREPVVKIRDELEVFITSDGGKKLPKDEQERCSMILRKYNAVLEVYDNSNGDQLTDSEQEEASRLFGELQALGPPPEVVVEKLVPPASASSSSKNTQSGAAAPASKEDAEEFAQFLKGMGFGDDSSGPGMDEESAKVMKEMIDNPDLLRQMMGDLDKAMQDVGKSGGDKQQQQQQPPQCCIIVNILIYWRAGMDCPTVAVSYACLNYHIMQRRVAGTLCPSQIRAVAALRSGLHPRVPRDQLSAVDGTLFRGLWRIARFFDKNPAYKSLITNAYRTVDEKQDPLYTEALRAYLAGADYYVPGKPVAVPGPDGHLTTATCASLSGGDSLVDLLRMCFRGDIHSTDSWFSALRHLSRIRALCDKVALEPSVSGEVPAWLKGAVEPYWGPVQPGLVLLAHPLCEEGTWTRSVIVITGGDKPDESRGQHGWRPDGLIINRKVEEGTRELQILRDQAAFFRSLRRNKRVGPSSPQRQSRAAQSGKEGGGSGSEGEGTTWMSDMHGKPKAQEGAFMTVLSHVTKDPTRWQFGGPVASVEVVHESVVRGVSPLRIGPNETSIGLYHGWRQNEDTEVLTEVATPRRTFAFGTLSVSPVQMPYVPSCSVGMT